MSKMSCGGPGKYECEEKSERVSETGRLLICFKMSILKQTLYLQLWFPYKKNTPQQTENSYNQTLIVRDLIEKIRGDAFL